MTTEIANNITDFERAYEKADLVIDPFYNRIQIKFEANKIVINKKNYFIDDIKEINSTDISSWEIVGYSFRFNFYLFKFMRE